MDYEAIVTRQKEVNRIYSELLFDINIFAKLTSGILNPSSAEVVNTPEYKQNCEYVKNTLCDRISEALLEFKPIIPNSNNTTTED